MRYRARVQGGLTEDVPYKAEDLVQKLSTHKPYIPQTPKAPAPLFPKPCCTKLTRRSLPFAKVYECEDIEIRNPDRWMGNIEA